MITYSARCKEVNDGVYSDYVFVITHSRLKHHRIGDIIQVAKFGNSYYFPFTSRVDDRNIIKAKIEEIIETSARLRY